MRSVRRESDGIECAERLDRRIGDFRISLRSDLKSIPADFAGLYGDNQAAPTGAARVIRMDVRKVGRSRLGRALYQIYGDGEPIAGPRHAEQVFPFLEWGINLRVMASDVPYVQLHAASMVRNGSGFIFAGPSGSGKSTLAAGLMTRGWGYLCDEFAMVHPNTASLHSFPKALCIKAGSFACIERLGLRFARRGDYIKGIKGRVAYLRPADVGSHTIADPAPIRYVIFPSYAAGRQPRLEPIARSRAILDLVAGVFNPDRYGMRTVSILTEAVRHAEMFRLDVGDLEETCRLLEERLCQATALSSMPSSSRVESAPPRSVRSGKLDRHRPRRRDILRLGGKLAYVAPTLMTLTAGQAFAAGSIPSTACSTGLDAGEICETDTDCCSGQCQLGTCT